MVNIFVHLSSFYSATIITSMDLHKANNIFFTHFSVIVDNYPSNICYVLETSVTLIARSLP